MPLYRPSELMVFLDSVGARPKKSLSQNFLIDGNIVKKIVDLAEVKKGDSVLEIGPGPGVLTEELLERGVQLVAVEKDTIFARELPRLGALDVRSQDILEFDFTALPKGTTVVSNIPYHLTSPILEKIIESKTVKRAVLMVQKELADRILAPMGTRECGSLSLFVQFHAKTTFGFTVKAGSFYPKPAVDSAVICLDLEKQFQVSDEKDFQKMVRAAFQERRKTLSRSLRDLYPPVNIQAALLAIGKSEKARPEELSLPNWIAFFEILYSK